MFTENELWQIVSLVSNADYYHASDFEFGLKVLDMLPDSENKTFYKRIFKQELKDLQESI